MRDEREVEQIEVELGGRKRLFDVHGHVEQRVREDAEDEDGGPGVEPVFVVDKVLEWPPEVAHKLVTRSTKLAHGKRVTQGTCACLGWVARMSTRDMVRAAYKVHRDAGPTEATLTDEERAVVTDVATEKLWDDEQARDEARRERMGEW